MSRIQVLCLCLIACALIAPDSLSADEVEGSQTIGSIKHRTPNYELHVFGAGHFAVKIGGVWMPGCICLNVNGVPQYQTEALAQMQADVEPLPDGRRIVITGHLTPEIAFTQTIEATPRAIALTYRCEALRDIDEANVSVTAGPQADRLDGRAYRIIAADGRAEAFCASADGTLYAIGPDGALMWTHESVAPLYQVAVAYMDEGAWVLTGGVTRELWCLNPEGNVQAQVAHDRVVRLVEAGDTDANGEDEVVMISHLGDMWIYEGANLEESYFDRTMRPIRDGVEGKSGHWRPYWLSLEDMDGDGATEMLIGSGFYNHNGIRMHDSDGSFVWHQPEGFSFRDGTHYSHTELAGLDALPAEEIAIEDGAAQMTVPAGAFRVLDAMVSGI